MFYGKEASQTLGGRRPAFQFRVLWRCYCFICRGLVLRCAKGYLETDTWRDVVYLCVETLISFVLVSAERQKKKKILNVNVVFLIHFSFVMLVFHIGVCLPTGVIKPLIDLHTFTLRLFVIRTLCSKDLPGYCPRRCVTEVCYARCPMCHMQTTRSTCFPSPPDGGQILLQSNVLRRGLVSLLLSARGQTAQQLF